MNYLTIKCANVKMIGSLSWDRIPDNLVAMSFHDADANDVLNVLPFLVSVFGKPLKQHKKVQFRFFRLRNVAMLSSKLVGFTFLRSSQFRCVIVQEDIDTGRNYTDNWIETTRSPP